MNLGTSFISKAIDADEHYEAQDHEGVVRNFLLGGVTEVPHISCATWYVTEKRGSPVICFDNSTDRSIHLR